MAVFTAVSSTDLEQWLEQYSIGTALALQGIVSGIENSNFFLSTTAGEYVLTIFERLQAAQLPFYLDLMRHLARHGVPVPDPVVRRDTRLFGELHGKPAAIVTRLPGRAMMAPNVEHCAEVGHMLARSHRAVTDFAGRQPNLRGLSWWREIAPRLYPFLSPAQWRLFSEELAHQSRFAQSADFANLPGGACHCDLFRDNALFLATASGERLGGFFDYYFAGCDKFLFDVAVCVNDWCIDAHSGALDPERTLALLQAYQTVRPFNAFEARAWRDMLRAAAMRFWSSRLYDLHLPRSAELLSAHDPAHFERILKQRISTASLPWS